MSLIFFFWGGEKRKKKKEWVAKWALLAHSKIIHDKREGGEPHGLEIEKVI